MFAARRPAGAVVVRTAQSSRQLSGRPFVAPERGATCKRRTVDFPRSRRSSTVAFRAQESAFACRRAEPRGTVDASVRFAAKYCALPRVTRERARSLTPSGRDE